MKKRVTVCTLGCKVNRYESACITDSFLKNNYELVSFNADADIYIINTCTVTNRTDFKSRNAIRRALMKKNKIKGSKVIVTGCYSELNRQQIEKIGNIDLITGNDDKQSIYELIKGLAAKNTDTQFSEMITDSMPERVRAFIKIQDGCDSFCSYCIVPYARGKPRSSTPEKVIQQVMRFIDAGYKEFVITGINLGLYKSTLSLTQLLERIETIEGVKRLRLSSIEPQLIDKSMLDYLKNSAKVCPHFHIPLQSGNDEILKRMKRQYSTQEYAALLERIREIIPDAAIGTDILLGFPGETEEHFDSTYRFIYNLPLTYAHIFPYSKREGTDAAEMPSQVLHSVTKERCKKLSALIENKKNIYIQTLIDNETVLTGVLENKVKIEKETEPYWTALSDHYIRMYVCGNTHGEGDLVSVKAVKKAQDGVIGVEQDSNLYNLHLD